MTNKRIVGGKTVLIIALAAVVAAAGAGAAWYFLGQAGPRFVKLDENAWEWHRLNTAEGMIEGYLILSGEASGGFTLAGVECDRPVVKASSLPREVKDFSNGRYQVNLGLTLPELKQGEAPYNIHLLYEQGKARGRLGPIKLYP